MSIFDQIDQAHEAYKARHRRNERLVTDECGCTACRSDMAGIVPCENDKEPGNE